MSPWEWAVVAGIAAVLALLWRWGPRRPDSLEAAGAGYAERLRRAAVLLGGTVVQERSTVGGHVTWNRWGFPFYYYEKGLEAGSWSVISIGIRDKLLPTLQVRPREGPVPQLPQLRVRPPQDARSEFDARFEVRIPATAPDSLGPSSVVCRRLLDLADLCFPHHPVLEVHEARVRLYLPTRLDTEDKRVRFLDHGAAIVEAILHEWVTEGAGKGVQVLDAMVMEGEAEETCRVCGERVVDQRVACAQCGTPHHRDCWEYVGGCSVFACQCKKAKE